MPEKIKREAAASVQTAMITLFTAVGPALADGVLTVGELLDIAQTAAKQTGLADKKLMDWNK